MALNDKVSTFETDVGLTHQLVHGDTATEVDTENGPLRSFAKLQQDLVDELNAADTIAETQQNRTAAEQAAGDAEAARDAAVVSAEVYADSAAGLAATVDGEFFKAVSPTEDGFLALYRNDAGSATLIDEYPSLSAIAKRALRSELDEINRQLVALMLSLHPETELGTLNFDFTRRRYLLGEAS